MPINKIAEFLRLEAAGGVVLFFMTLVAIIFVNSPLHEVYDAIINAPISLRVNDLLISHPLIFWVNDALMAIFFLLVGLELKREFLEGELSSPSKILLPGIAALGGMIFPALIYTLFNQGSAIAMKGWAIPVATDIAFAVGVLSFFSHRIPLSLKLFLLALAVFDDVGAIIIIAIFYSHDFSLVYFLLSCLIIFILWMFNYVFSVKRLLPYIVLGVLLWCCILRSGIHASISGVLLAMMIPLGENSEDGSALHYLEAKLHPWVVFFILPLFAFVNAGLSFQGFSWATLFDPVVLGIIAGLLIGKQLGVLSFVWMTTRLGWSKLPESVSWADIYGVALLCGIGFTMSLFLGTLAFQVDHPLYMMEVRLGVFVGSMLSALVGALVLHMTLRK